MRDAPRLRPHLSAEVPPIRPRVSAQRVWQRAAAVAAALLASTLLSCSSLCRTIPCRQRCNRVYADCGHRCPKECCEECDASCQTGVPKLMPCGHVQQMPCSVPIAEWECKQACERPRPCGHPCPVACGKPCPPLCMVRVPLVRPCGHRLFAACSQVCDVGDSRWCVRCISSRALPMIPIQLVRLPGTVCRPTNSSRHPAASHAVPSCRAATCALAVARPAATRVEATSRARSRARASGAPTSAAPGSAPCSRACSRTTHARSAAPRALRAAIRAWGSAARPGELLSCHGHPLAPFQWVASPLCS